MGSEMCIRDRRGTLQKNPRGSLTRHLRCASVLRLPLIERFVHSLSLAILISEKSLGNHADNLDANALTCWRFDEVYILILPSSCCTVVEQQFVWAMVQADSCGSRSVLCEAGLKWPSNGRTRGSGGGRDYGRPRQAQAMASAAGGAVSRPI